ncbi:MAG: hypothetical protein QOF10_6965 [Kribbellaceae bacterium]|jgi:hypothetical protein|nr:hypothetical protein [Kribbellaceae bacterium]
MGAEVLIGVAEQGSDDERLEELALLLRQELLTLDVDSVEAYEDGDAPEGTRGALAAVAGVLTVGLGPSAQAIGAVMSLVRDWLRRSGTERSVRIEIDGDVIELKGTTTEVQQQLVDDWIKKHAGAG